MADYNKPRFSNKKPFQKRGFDSGAPKEMHRADCAKCGKPCEVPFRPNGKKPIFCNNCFERDESGPQRSNSSSSYGSGAPRRDFGPRNDFAPRPAHHTAHQPAAAPRDDRALMALKGELEGVNQKLDRLITLMTPVTPSSPAAIEKAAAVKKAVKSVTKSVTKKVAKKK